MARIRLRETSPKKRKSEDLVPVVSHDGLLGGDVELLVDGRWRCPRWRTRVLRLDVREVRLLDSSDSRSRPAVPALRWGGARGDLDVVAGQTDHALDVIRRGAVARVRRIEDDDVSARWVAEGVGDLAGDQVVVVLEGVLHAVAVHPHRLDARPDERVEDVADQQDLEEIPDPVLRARSGAAGSGRGGA